MPGFQLAEAGIAQLDELAARDGVPAPAIDRMRQSLNARIKNTRRYLEPGEDAGQDALPEAEVRRDVIAAENAELSRLYADGVISAATRRRLQHLLDLELARFSDEPR